MTARKRVADLIDLVRIESRSGVQSEISENAKLAGWKGDILSELLTVCREARKFDNLVDGRQSRFVILIQLKLHSRP